MLLIFMLNIYKKNDSEIVTCTDSWKFENVLSKYVTEINLV